VIAHVVWLYFRFPMSLRLVEDLLTARVVIVSHQSFHDQISNLFKVPRHDSPSAHHRELRSAVVLALRQIARLHAV